MIEELAGLGVVVDVAGPSQHVPVVERKIPTIKEREYVRMRTALDNQYHALSHSGMHRTSIDR